MIMNFPSKFTLAVATASIFYPIAAYAGPTTGSTAAAVSIKFQDCHCGPTSGNFSITPGGTASGGGSGVQELSAAVATGETKAQAEAGSGRSGERGRSVTDASAKGYSAPVHFSYKTYSDVSNKKYDSEYTYHSKYEKEAAIEFAANQKDSEYAYKSETEKVKLVKKGNDYGYYHNGEFIKYISEETETKKSGSTSEGSVTLNAKLEASASVDKTGKNSKVSNSNESGTSYEYTGSSAGLTFIPAIVK
jgi:hypothetical protein